MIGFGEAGLKKDGCKIKARICFNARDNTACIFAKSDFVEPDGRVERLIRSYFGGADSRLAGQGTGCPFFSCINATDTNRHRNHLTRPDTRLHNQAVTVNHPNDFGRDGPRQHFGG